MSVAWPWPSGTIVVCVEAEDDQLTVNELYTIKESWTNGVDRETGLPSPGVALNELIPSNGDDGFNARCFRPLESDHDEAAMLRREELPCAT